MIKRLKVDIGCASCAININKVLAKHNVEATSNPVLKIIKINFDENKISWDEIKSEIKRIGYDAEEL